MRPQITEEEKKLEFSSLFFKPLPEVDAKLLQEMEASPVNPARITSVHQRNDILKPGYLEVENGYAKMEDGSGCVATKVEMPGVTPEMIEWWFMWHGQQDLRYKIWCPTHHYAAHVLEKDLPRRLGQIIVLKGAELEHDGCGNRGCRCRPAEDASVLFLTGGLRI